MPRETARFTAFFSLIFVLQLLSPLTGFAAVKTLTPLQIISSSESSVKIDGDSTARKYSATAKPVAVSGQATPNTHESGASASNLPWIPQEVEMSLPVANLTSGERTLDKHMRENLKAEQHPIIQLKLSHFDFAGGGPGPSNAVKATGELTVAGVTRPVALEPTITVDHQQVTIKGKQRVLMSAFGITPPVLMMGTLKTKDEIDISYNVVLLPNPVQKKAGS